MTEDKKLIEVKAKEIRDLDKDLTLKQKAFLKRYLETGNGTKAALEVYDTEDINTAAAIASETLRKLKSPIRTFMESKGISLGYLCTVLEEGLRAKRVISAVNTNKQATGADTDFIEVPDHEVRHKYLTTASKWLGIDKEEQITQQNIQINVIPILGKDLKAE